MQDVGLAGGGRHPECSLLQVVRCEIGDSMQVTPVPLLAMKLDQVGEQPVGVGEQPVEVVGSE